MSQPQPKAAELITPFRLRIQWRDGIVTEHDARPLRLNCPCAQCVDESSGRRVLQPDSVPEDILLVAAEPVGRYALSFVWSDGHRTGIFTWPHLRRLAGVSESADE